jgi:hypothetical protein
MHEQAGTRKGTGSKLFCSASMSEQQGSSNEASSKMMIDMV